MRGACARVVRGKVITALIATAVWAGAGELAPRGKVHIPIGIAHTNDRPKTFVEPEGCFSPGVGSYGIYFDASDPGAGNVQVAPTDRSVKVEYGLPPGGALIPWSRWRAGPLEITTEVCHTIQNSPAGPVHVTRGGRTRWRRSRRTRPWR
jgi:hypothetical protein